MPSVAKKRIMSGLVAAALLCVMAATPTPSEAASKAAVAVEVRAEDVSGVRPDGSTVTFRIKIVAEGPDASLLAGEGRHFGASHNFWPATGSMDGDVVTFAGVISDSSNPFLIGRPVEVVTLLSTGSVTLTTSFCVCGPYNGETLVAKGHGRVKITTGE